MRPESHNQQEISHLALASRVKVEFELGRGVRVVYGDGLEI